MKSKGGSLEKPFAFLSLWKEHRFLSYSKLCSEHLWPEKRPVKSICSCGRGEKQRGVQRESKEEIEGKGRENWVCQANERNSWWGGKDLKTLPKHRHSPPKLKLSTDYS